MAKLNTKQSSSIHRCIVFGGPKSGKTMLAGELAEYYNLIWFDLENGHETLFQLPEEWQQRIELINIPDTRSYPMAIETCLKAVKQKCVICEEHGKVGCMICQRHEAPTITTNLPELKDQETVVVFDSLTQLTSSAIANITKAEPDDYKLQIDDWGNLGKLLEIFLSHIQQSGYHVVMISHESEITTEGKKKKLVPVGGSRNFSRNVAKYFDHVIYAEVKNKKHTFASSTTHATTILTGSRTGADLSVGDKPSLLQIFKPELYPASTESVSPITKAVPKTGGDAAKDILARLKNK